MGAAGACRDPPAGQRDREVSGRDDVQAGPELTWRDHHKVSAPGHPLDVPHCPCGGQHLREGPAGWDLCRSGHLDEPPAGPGRDSGQEYPDRPRGHPGRMIWRCTPFGPMTIWRWIPGPATAQGGRPAAPMLNRAGPTCATGTVGDDWAKPTSRPMMTPASTAATTQPAARLVMARRAEAPWPGRWPAPACSGSGAVAPSAGGAGSAPPACSCSSTSAHLTVGCIRECHAPWSLAGLYAVHTLCVSSA